MREAVAPDLEAVRRVIREEIRNLEVRDRRDLFAAAQREAVASSARLAAERMPLVPTYPRPVDTLRAALALAPAGGLALEFGVFTGSTLRVVAAERDGDVYGFDSFEGLPEGWRTGFPEGAFSLQELDTPDLVEQEPGGLRLPDVPGAELIAGWFTDTLPGFMDAHPGPVDFLHVDCDLYSSTVTVLELVGPRLRPGSVVLFDEYFNYPGWQSGEFLAWEEYVAAHGLEYDYEGYTLADEQVIVRLR